jgi:hypothetical protein
VALWLDVEQLTDEYARRIRIVTLMGVSNTSNTKKYYIIIKPRVSLTKNHTKSSTASIKTNQTPVV